MKRGREKGWVPAARPGEDPVMNDDPLMARARRLWETLAGVPAPFAPDG